MKQEELFISRTLRPRLYERSTISDSLYGTFSGKEGGSDGKEGGSDGKEGFYSGEGGGDGDGGGDGRSFRPIRQGVPVFVSATELV